MVSKEKAELERMTYREVQEVFNESKDRARVVVIPLAATAHHGSQLPLDIDIWAMIAPAKRATQESLLVVAPVMSTAPISPHEF